MATREDRIVMPPSSPPNGRRSLRPARRPRTGPRLYRRLVLAVSGLGAALWPAIALASTPRPPWHPGPPWAPLAPHSGEMRQISDLFWVMLVLSGIILAGVTGALITSAVRFSARPGSPEPTQVFGNRRVELAWTIIPTFILMVAFVFTVKYIHDINTPVKGVFAQGAIMNVNVIGHQWWWEFAYPPQPQFGITRGIDTADELHIPAGASIHFHITSHDVIHSFWTPQLQRQIDANPAQDNAVFVRLDHPGVYAGACYEYCGDAHAWMKYEVVVQPPTQFKAWALAQSRPAATPRTALARAGQQVFDSSSCVNCHVITYKGSPAVGPVGPNLTHLAIRWTLGAGAAPLTRNDLMAWIHDPNTYKPGVLMPPFPFLSKHDLQALAAYLLSLK